VAFTILSVYFKYDWLYCNVADSEVKKEKARNDSVWAVFDFRLFGSIFPANANT
jgi:hypothetical protein